MYKAIDISRWFISFVDKNHGDLITNLKVQKLLYYAEAWSQVFYNRTLFEEDIQAWAHGPVVPEVYHAFKNRGLEPLELDRALEKLDDEALEILEEVQSIYGELTAKSLEIMTRQDTPWLRARNGLSEEAVCNTVIPKHEIKEFYQTKFL